MRYLAANAGETSGDIFFMGRSLMSAPPSELERLRGGKLGMIFQNPSSSLNPTLTIGEQITESLTLHRGMDRRPAWDQAARILSGVDIQNPAKILRSEEHKSEFQSLMRISYAVFCLKKKK